MMTVIASYAKRLCQDGETDRRVIAWTDGNEFAKQMILEAPKTFARCSTALGVLVPRS